MLMLRILASPSRMCRVRVSAIAISIAVYMVVATQIADIAIAAEEASHNHLDEIKCSDDALHPHQQSASHNSRALRDAVRDEPDYRLPAPEKRVRLSSFESYVFGGAYSRVVPDTGELTRCDGNDAPPPAVSPGAERGGVGVLRGVYTHTNTLQEYGDSDAEFYQVFTIDDRDLIAMEQPHRHIELTRLKQRPDIITYKTEKSRRGRARKLQPERYFDEQSTKENLDEDCCLFRIAYPIDIFVQKDERYVFSFFSFGLQ